MQTISKQTTTKEEQDVWFAMSATYNRALKAQDFLRTNDVECFVPMRYEIITDRSNKKSKCLVPAVRNLIFANCCKSRLQALKSQLGYLHYLTKPQDGRNVPIIVPHKQMEQFISVCETHNNNLIYLSPEEANLNHGTHVRIIGGPFDGIEGKYVKIEKKRNKCVAIEVEGVATILITQLNDALLHVLDKD
jgi:hypothetical protein